MKGYQRAHPADSLVLFILLIYTNYSPRDLKYSNR